MADAARRSFCGLLSVCRLSIVSHGVANTMMTRRSRVQFAGDTQLRYRAYARDHGMTPEQIRSNDREICPDSLLLPYLSWLSKKWYEWGKLNPDRAIRGPKEHADFDRWLEELTPGLNAITCECHMRLARRRT